MKKTLVLLLLAALVLAGCGKNDEPESYLYAAPPASHWYETPESGSAASGAGHELDEEGRAAKAGEEVYIKEKMFIAQSNDIYLNPDDYMGKTIRYEGIFVSQTDIITEITHHYVIRYGPGCCGYDGEAGFEVEWEDEYPPQDAWVEVAGVLDMYEKNGWPILFLRVTSLEEKAERGAEYVKQ